MKADLRIVVKDCRRNKTLRISLLRVPFVPRQFFVRMNGARWPGSEEKLRAIPPFEFENWAVIALGGRKNKAQVGDKGIDGRIFPVSALDNVREAGADELALEERFYPMQVKQKDKTGRPDIDAFETAMRRAKCEKGFFVSFDYSSDALHEIDRFFREEHRIIIPLTVRDILDEEIARKLA